MAVVQIFGSSLSTGTLASSKGICCPSVKSYSFKPTSVKLSNRSFRGAFVKAAAVVDQVQLSHTRVMYVPDFIVREAYDADDIIDTFILKKSGRQYVEEDVVVLRRVRICSPERWDIKFSTGLDQIGKKSSENVAGYLLHQDVIYRPKMQLILLEVFRITTYKGLG